MSVDAGLVELISEALEPLGPVTKRNMFGGVSLYLDGVIFAIATADALWFKSDRVSDAIWDAEDCPRFTYDFGDGKMSGSMNYRRAPDDVYDDEEAMQKWASLGLEAGRRAPAKKAKAKQKPTA
jgi:DNA transformation protein and related proteins